MQHRHVSLVCSLLVGIAILLAACGTPSSDPHTNGLKVGTNFSPPLVTALTPNIAPANSVPFTMTVSGTNFLPDAVVFWNGQPVFTRFVDSQHLFAELSSTNLALRGFIRVYVRTAGLNSNTVEFDLQ